jgi:Uma2 family endonuclease
MDGGPDVASATIKEPLASVETLADLLDRLGNVPLDRIRFHPLPGLARERDVIAALEGVDKRLYELIDGVLVEKPMGTREALIATLIGYHLMLYLEEHDLGLILGADGSVRLWRGRIRIPDVSFISWGRLPEGQLPDEAIATIVPDLAVEVLSESNTTKEITAKIDDFFRAGTRLFWVVDPKTATAEVYTSPTSRRHIGKNGALDGGDVLPGFSLSLSKLFARTKKNRK